MATPVVYDAPHASFAPGSYPNENTPADAQVGYTFSVTLTGTTANVAADYATIKATNFASPSANLTWRRDH